MSEFLDDKELANEILAHANALQVRQLGGEVLKHARSERIDLDDRWSISMGRSNANLERLLSNILANGEGVPYDQVTIMTGDDERTRILAVGEGQSLETGPQTIEDVLDHPGVEHNAAHCTLKVGQIALLDIEFTPHGEETRVAENFIALSVANQFLSQQ